MQGAFRGTTTQALLRDVGRLERRLIAGEARDDEIDRYVASQIELAERGEFGAADPLPGWPDNVLDPRD